MRRGTYASYVVAGLLLFGSGCGLGTVSEAEFIDQYGVGDIDNVPFAGEDMLDGKRAQAAMTAILTRVGVTPSTSRLLSAHFDPTGMGVVIGVKGRTDAFDRVYVNVWDDLLDPSPERVDDDDVNGMTFEASVIPYDRFPAMRLTAMKVLGMTINQVRSMHLSRRSPGGDVVVSVSADDRRRSGTVTFSLDGTVLETQGGALTTGGASSVTTTSEVTTTVDGVSTTVTIETK